MLVAIFLVKIKLDHEDFATYSPTATNLHHPHGHFVPVPPGCKRNPAVEESDMM
jgi:hypothetical protein